MTPPDDTMRLTAFFQKAVLLKAGHSVTSTRMPTVAEMGIWKKKISEIIESRGGKILESTDIEINGKYNRRLVIEFHQNLFKGVNAALQSEVTGRFDSVVLLPFSHTAAGSFIRYQ